MKVHVIQSILGVEHAPNYRTLDFNDFHQVVFDSLLDLEVV